MAISEFHHVFTDGKPNIPVLLLLHGTGGDEHDLIPLAQTVAPDATLLSIRGKVLENGMPRFFRRFETGVFDQDDLKFRTDELADFILFAREHYKLAQPVIALGFSNGANIAASLLFRRPEVLDGAILLRAMKPFQPDCLPDLSGKNILLLNGLFDPLIPIDQARELASMLEQSKAAVAFKEKPAAHNLVNSDLADMASWLETISRK